MGRIQQYSALSCAVNPACGREQDFALAPAAKSKRVLIAGGGVAGCEAARVLALRGHKAVLFERSGRLGGNLIRAARRISNRTIWRWPSGMPTPWTVWASRSA